MSYSPLDGPDTSLAGFAHLGAVIGPVIPWLVWRVRREEDPFVAREAAKATNAGMAFLVAFAAGTLIWMFVPFVGFVGRMLQVAVIVVALVLCVNAFRRVRRGVPTSYPVQIRVLSLED
ncbi:MAG: DUF4870 domain-containing protein [Demequina sp.]|jgi:uncharacterized Tic20 family protein|nr:DUF4870 domain-containing protein [Demequina sp.]